jgi:hypothetical protein
VGFGVFPQIGELEVGTKLLLFEHPSFSSALSFGWSPQKKDFDFNLIGGLSMPIFEVYINGGFSSKGDHITGGILLTKPLMDEKIVLGIEANPDYNREDGELSLSGQIGIAYVLKDGFTLDVGGGISEVSWQITSGITYDF